MAQLVHAFIEHRLTLEEILNLPDHLQQISDDILVGQWNWSAPNMNKQVLIGIFTRKLDFFFNNSWSVQDLALLEKDNMTIHFSAPHLVTFDNSYRWDTYRIYEQQRQEFNRMTRALSLLLSAVDVLMVPDLSSVDFFDENEDLTVAAYRQKSNGNELYAIELD